MVKNGHLVNKCGKMTLKCVLCGYRPGFGQVLNMVEI